MKQYTTIDLSDMMAQNAEQAQRIADLEAEVERITEAGRVHIRRAAAFEAQRDELLACLRDCVEYVDEEELKHVAAYGERHHAARLARVREDAKTARAAIARAEGGADAGAVRDAEPLFLLYCGAPFGGEIGDWEVEVNSQRAVDELTAQHPGETLRLYVLTPDEVATVLRSRARAEGGAA